MKIDPKEVGRRITQARKKADLTRPALADKIFQDSEKKGRNKIDPETVRLWEVGKHLPPWDKIDQLCELLSIEQEELLFGPMREAQLRNDRPRLVYITMTEADLIISFRHGSPAAQKRIIESARSLSADDPAPIADFHLLKPLSK